MSIVEIITGFEVIVSREILEETLVIGTLTIFKAFELDLSRLLFFSLFDFLSGFRNVKRVDRIESEELKSPNDISSVFDVAGFLEALEGNRLSVILAIERADNNESGIGIALKLFKLANGIINTELDRIFRGRNDLKIIETNNGSFVFVLA